MSSRGSKRPVKGYVRDPRRRKMVLDVDLNDIPQSERRVEAVATTSHGASFVEQLTSQGAPLPPAPIDVEAIDDEVIISSPRSFAEARNQSRRNHQVMTVVLDEDSDIHQGRSVAAAEEPMTRLTLNSYNSHERSSSNGIIERSSSNGAVINCELYINLEGSHSTKRRKITKPALQPRITVTNPAPEAPLAPKEPIFSCAVCMGPLVEETSTICGHIFCKKCIKAAIGAQKKCPTCRHKLTMNNIHRVYLPTTS